MTDSAKIGCYSAEETDTGNSAFEGPSFVCGQSAPDPVILSGIHGPSQAGVSDLTAAADDFCLVDLVKRRVGVPNREKQLWVLVQAGSTTAPRHQDQAPCIEDWGEPHGVNSCGEPGRLRSGPIQDVAEHVCDNRDFRPPGSLTGHPTARQLQNRTAAHSNRRTGHPWPGCAEIPNLMGGPRLGHARPFTVADVHHHE